MFVLIIGILSIALQVYGVSRITYVKAEEPEISFRQEVWLKTLSFCESSGRSDIKIMDSNNRYSYGAYMFQLDTFKRNGIKYEFFKSDITNKELEKLIYDPNLQEKIAHKMLLDGGESNWYNCWKIKLKTKYPK